MDFTIRPYRRGEEEYVARLHERLYSEEYGWGPEFVRYAVEIPRHFAGKERNDREELFIAEQGGRPVGSMMLCATEDPDVGQLRVFAVEKDCRRQGIGAALLQAALEKAKSAGYTKLILWTADAVTDALRKYETLGFRVMETKENRSWRPDGEAVIEIKMEKELV
ncbi:MAG: GNAT family N-acetyltransferase [Eubacteriales bacterium]|nr:GNAT family N-acetyltransferase [Eubacteriales bacterium]